MFQTDRSKPNAKHRSTVEKNVRGAPSGISSAKQTPARDGPFMWKTNVSLRIRVPLLRTEPIRYNRRCPPATRQRLSCLPRYRTNLRRGGRVAEGGGLLN